MVKHSGWLLGLGLGVLLLVISPVGCSGPEPRLQQAKSDTDGGIERVDGEVGGQAHEACLAINEAQCRTLYRCFGHDELQDIESQAGFSDVSSCTLVLADATCARVQQAETSGRLRLVRAELATCLEELESQVCPDSFLELFARGPASCDRAFVGQVEQGGACDSPLECAAENGDCLGPGVCSGPLVGESYEVECTQETVGECAGYVCLVLKSNLQKKTGICSARCGDAHDCGRGATCYRVGEAAICLKDCEQDADCANGFSCVPVGANGERACFVEVPR